MSVKVREYRSRTKKPEKRDEETYEGDITFRWPDSEGGADQEPGQLEVRREGMGRTPAKAIQERAGHENLSTTQRYMHLSPAAKDAAISLLDEATS